MDEAETGEPRAFRVEVVIDEPREVVWAALTEPEQLRQWFGWDYDGLDAEIDHIFVEHADRFPPDRIALEVGQEIQVEAKGNSTVLRAVMPGVLDDTEADQPYDELAEGWLSFFEQLRYLLERRPTGRRRTLHLTGTGNGAALVEAVVEAGVKETWQDSRYQRIVVDPAGHLVVVTAQEPLDSAGTDSPVTLTVNTWGVTDDELGRLREQWTSRVRAVASAVEVSG